MRLIETASSPDSLKLREFFGSNTPPYAILSHTWSDDEVLHQDVIAGTSASRKGFVKVVGAMNMAQRDGFAYLWIDTCCIDKTSSAELGEAMNSMFGWYRQSEMCYVYLEDVTCERDSKGMHSPFGRSRWFTRGWTLQELVAPRCLTFFSGAWDFLGKINKPGSPEQAQILRIVSAASDIAISVLTGTVQLDSVSIAARMSWMANRSTARVEDVAYSMLGLFGVSMPLLYGEGDRAFIRLQEEIMKISDDNSIFAWQLRDSSGHHRLHGLLASSPSCFANARTIERSLTVKDSHLELSPYLMTNKGLQIELPLKDLIDDIYVATLNCEYRESNGWVAIYLKRLAPRTNQFARISADQLTSVYWHERGIPERLFVRQESAGFSWSQHEDRASRTTYWMSLGSINMIKGGSSARYEEEEIGSEDLVDTWQLVSDGTSNYLYSSTGEPKAKVHKLRARVNSVAMLLKSNVLSPQLILILGSVDEAYFGYDVVLADAQYCTRFAARDPKVRDILMADRQLHPPWQQITKDRYEVRLEILDVQLGTFRLADFSLSSATNYADGPRPRLPLSSSNARGDEARYEKRFKFRLIVNEESYCYPPPLRMRSRS